jgi:hypothetical protein
VVAWLERAGRNQSRIRTIQRSARGGDIHGSSSDAAPCAGPWQAGAKVTPGRRAPIASLQFEGEQILHSGAPTRSALFPAAAAPGTMRGRKSLARFLLLWGAPIGAAQSGRPNQWLTQAWRGRRDDVASKHEHASE